MSGTDETEAQSGLPQAWSGTQRVAVPVSDLAPAAAPAKIVVGQLPTLPPVPPRAPGDAPNAHAKTPEEVERWQGVIASYEREAKALGNDPRAAGLYLEMGRVWEEQLGKARNAANCYQKAFLIAPKNLAVLHASRRLFTEVGNWGMVVQIVQAEIDATGDPLVRANLLAEKGTILAQKLKNDAEAQKAFKDAIELSPADPLAIESLEQIHLQHGEHAALFKLYVGAAEATETPEHKIALLDAAAHLAEDRLDDAKGALVLYEKVLALEPKHAGALAALRRLNAASERWEALVDALSRSAAAATSDAERTSLLMQAATIQQDRLGATDKALVTLLSGLERAAKDLSLLRAIEWLYQANGRHEDVAKVLRFEIDALSSPAERAPLMVRLAVVHEDRLGQTAEAIVALEEAMRAVPGYPPAVAPLARAYEKLGRYDSLAKLLEGEVARSDRSVEERVLDLSQLAAIYEGPLSRDADAVRALGQWLALRPTDSPALKALERLFHKAERWPELVQLYEQEIEVASDVSNKVYLLGFLGEIFELKTGEPERAIDAYERLLALRPGQLVAIRALARLFEKAGRWADVVRALRLEIEVTSDAAELANLHHAVARLQEERLADPAGAAAGYERVLELAPGHPPTLIALERLYTREGRWEALIEMIRRQPAGTPERERERTRRIAAITLEKMKDEARARVAYEELLAAEPGALDVLDTLAELSRRTGDLERLAAVLVERATHGPEGERGQLLAAAADLYEHKLGKLERAIELRRECLAKSPSDAALEAQLRLYTAQGSWPALFSVLEVALERADTPSAKARLLVRIAELSGDRLGRPDRAAMALEQAQALAPDDADVLRQLERVYIARKDWPKVVEVSERLAALEKDPKEYAARHIRLGTIKETELDPPQQGTSHFLAALERVPGHSMALRLVEVAYRKAQAWEGLAALYHREAVLATDADRKSSLFYRAGDVCEHRLKLDARAAPMYRLALEASGGQSIPAMRALARVAERRGDGSTALEMIRQEANAAADPERSLQLLVEQGEVFQDKLGDLPKAIEAFTQVLAKAPQHTKAFHRLETIYSNQGASKPLLEVLVARAKAIDGADEQAELYLGAARVAQDELKDKVRAMELYREVLERKPLHPKALQRVGPLYVEAQAWAEALDAYHKLVTVTNDTALRAQAYRALGTIYEEQRQDLVKAVQAYQHAVQADPNDADSLSRLARVYKSAQDWGSSVNVLLRLVEVQREPAQRIATLLELGSIYETGFGDLDNAALAFQKALELDPSNTTVILKVAELYERAGNWRLLGQVAEQFLRALPPNDRRRALPLQLKMAEVYEQRLGDDGKATSELRTALEIDPVNVPALVQLGRLYGKAAASFPQAIEVHRRLLRLDPFRVESYSELRRLFEKRGDFDKAFVCAEILVFFRAAKQDEDLFYQEHKDRVAAMTELALSPEDHERLVVHPEERNGARVLLEILSLELSKAYPADLSRYEMNPRTDKHGPKSDLAVRKTADALARVLGTPSYDLWVTRKFELGWFLENEEVPALVMGAGIPRRVQEKELRFLLARQLERIKAGHQLWVSKEGFKIPPAELDMLIWSAAKLAKPDLRVERDAVDLDRMMKLVSKHISRRGKKALEDAAPRIGALRFELERQRWASIHTANRAGLVLANDIEIVLRAIAREAGFRPGFADVNGAREALGASPEIKELLSYAVSEEYFAARTKLKFSIQS